MSDINLMHGDCLELMKEIPDGSVDLVLTDPPYGTMKGAPIDGWCRKDDCAEWDTSLQTDKMFRQISRILRQNGKAVIFSQEPYTSKLITQAIQPLPFSYRAIWYKNVHGNSLISKSCMVSRFEDICIFTKPYDEECTNELRNYFSKVVSFCGGKKKIIDKIGSVADHTTRVDSSQFSLCTEQTYNAIIYEFNLDSMDGFLSYSKLKRLNAKYTSTFNLWQGGKSKSNVLEYPKDADGFHPTQKPLKLLEDLIQTYSNEGDIILDFTMGSGSTGVACVNTGRNFVGIELNDTYFGIAKKRIESAKAGYVYRKESSDQNSSKNMKLF